MVWYLFQSKYLFYYRVVIWTINLVTQMLIFSGGQDLIELQGVWLIFPSVYILDELVFQQFQVWYLGDLIL